MKLGVVLSAGGSAFGQVAHIAGPDVEFVAITARACPAEGLASALGLECIRVSGEGRASVSRAIADLALERGLRSVLLNYDRLVTADLFETVPTFNVHPAALPAFKGLHGVEDAHAAGAHLLGCTLHKVDETMDGGAIVSQIVRSADPSWSLRRWQKLAYLMKVYCGLVWAAGELGVLRPGTGLNASHDLPANWRESFLALQRAEGEAVIADDPAVLRDLRIA